jgi:D-alanyl-D-alanine carboxypeptidase
MMPDTLVRLGSITKMFTAVVVLQLAQEGKLDLDAPIATWLPDIVQLADTTTPRHLLHHSSGIFDYLEDRRFFGPAYQNPNRGWSPAELVAMANQFGPAFRPGTEGAWQYSSTNYVILGMLVEQVTGRPMAQEMRQRIFEPLGLTHTFFSPYEKPQGTLAQGYIDYSDRADVSMTFVFATGNIVSTADDLRRFVDALFGGQLLTDESLRMMATVEDTGGAYEMPELRYGLGVMGALLNVGPGPDGARRPDEISTVLGHIGGIAGFRSAVWWAPESGITIALVVNQADLDPNVLARDVLEVVLTWQGR